VLEDIGILLVPAVVVVTVVGAVDEVTGVFDTAAAV